MLENQTHLNPKHNNSIIKWVALTIGGCIVAIACLTLASILVMRLFSPQISGITSQIISGLNARPELSPLTTTPAVITPPQSIFNTMGDKNAPVKIIEYADFQCPFCRQYWQETEPQIIKTYIATGKVFYEYRSVGAFIGPESASAAKAAYCAGDQGKFWEYHDVLYSNWTGENVGDFAPDKLSQYAVATGLAQKTFEECLSLDKYSNQIQEDVANAKASGIHSTPSFLINGKLIEGALPFSVFQHVIDTALKGN